MVHDYKNLVNQIKVILDRALFLNGQTKNWSDQTRLNGNIPELDSMSVMNVVAGIENHFDFFMEYDDLSAEVFETMQTLTIYIQKKLNNTELVNLL